MPLPKFLVTIISLAALSLLASCSGNQSEEITLIGKQTTQTEKIAGNHSLSLSAEETTLYQDGIRGLIGVSNETKFVSVKTMKLGAEHGRHICGYARYKDATGTSQETPFYVEIRTVDGKPTLHRGQLGSDASKLSKVKFVCRHHAVF